jgi:pimeloyl-ACP methyl ester carboxylesterase
MTPKQRTLALLALGTFAAGLAALVVRRKTRRAEEENPPRGRFIEVDGVTLHYVDRGIGQPVVLLHGNGTMSQDFDLSGVLDIAAQRYRVIAFDRPGYGYSTRPRDRTWTPQAQAQLLHEALARLGVERPIVVGHSWGTLVALALALLHPGAVKSLVLLSGYYFPTVRLDVPILSSPAIPYLGGVMRHTISPLLGRLAWPALAKQMFGPAPVPRRFAAFPKWLSLRPSQLRASAAEAALLIPAASSLSQHYGEIRTPAILLAGAADRVVAPKHSERLHAKLLRSELRTVPATGHMFHYLWPRKVVAAIDQAAGEAATIRARPGVL